MELPPFEMDILDLQLQFNKNISLEVILQDKARSS